MSAPAVLSTHADTSDTAISIDRLSKRFGRTLAVEGLTLSVAAGEVFGFLGPNGAGKSTTIRLLLGLIRPTAGAVRVFGHDGRDVRRAHRHLAYVPADVALWPLLTGDSSASSWRPPITENPRL